ncbi:MAG TPA: HD domain-containing phosphohydrolase [Acidimicrobiia bacterium]
MTDSQKMTDQVRAADVIGSLCLATDMGMGFPFEHGLQATLTTMRLCEALDVDQETLRRTYYACLLMYVGCTVDEVERSEIFGGSMTEHHTHRQFGSRLESLGGVARALPSPGASWPRRTWQVVTGLPTAARFVDGHLVALCEVAGMLAERLGVPESIHGMFPLLTERWDGRSILGRASGEEIPLPLRIIQVGRDAGYQRLIGDDEYVKEIIRSRAGKAFDPSIVRVFLDNASDVLGAAAVPGSAWNQVLASEPRPWLTLDGPEIDRALSAIGAFADLVSPYLTGHSSGVSRLAATAAEIHGFEPSEVATIRRAGFIHDVGRTAVSSRIWDKPGPLTADEREQARLHPYHTERVLAHSPFLSEVASVAMAHHERPDGSGYHRGLDVSSLSPAARLLAAADAFRSKTEPRPYRHALTPEEATEVLVSKAEQGAFDPAMITAVAKAAGQVPPTIEGPAGLTEREVEVVGLLARGLKTKQIARELDISPKTVDRHIQNSYRKMGVSSRAAATLFAAENGLVPT